MVFGLRKHKAGCIFKSLTGQNIPKLLEGFYETITVDRQHVVAFVFVLYAKYGN